ncbi:MAG TPA: O-methyltransferase [Pyrinomonadaceae bacterium]|jgi:predicted O-methyltransferase YrrM|nr:O-methyltransferase [Pyrinomonadaceae bacterium]
MKARADAIIRSEQAEYLDRLMPAGTGVVAEMEEYAAEHRVPIADREVAAFLEITARSIGARRVLEIGLAIGYGALHLARALPEDGEVVTVEPSEEMISLAEGYLTRAGLRGSVTIERGYALEVLPRLEGPFDLVYLDAVKEEYYDYLEASLPLLRTGGVVVADNLLWGGQVAGEVRAPEQTASTQALREFNQRFVRHPQLLAVVLSVGDGLGYAVKTG